MKPEIKISLDIINDYREKTFCYHPGMRLNSKQDAIDFVNKRGVIFFWPIRDIIFPSLWGAVAGNRPVPNNHDDPAHKTWGWKDDLLGKNVWFYAKILRQKSTIISLCLLPFFYALSPNYGSPEDDYLINYEAGTLSNEEKNVYEALLTYGPLDTLSLRRAAKLTAKENSSRFNRAILLLQRDFRIMPVGFAETGAWRYSFIFDAVHHHLPSLVEEAHTINEVQAHREIIKSVFLSLGAATYHQIKLLLQWPDSAIVNTLESLAQKEFLTAHVQIQGLPDDWFTINSLIK